MSTMADEIDTQVQVEDFQQCSICEQIMTTKGTEHLFLKSISVWINKPHVVNRRLCGSKIVDALRVYSKEEAEEAVDKYKSFYNTDTRNEADVGTVNSFHFTDLVNEAATFTVIIRELIPKSEFFPKLLEAVVYDKQKVSVSFIPIDQDCTGKTEDLKPTKELMYKFELLTNGKVNQIKLAWTCDHNDSDQSRTEISSQWLKSVLHEKLINWSQVENISTSVTSLQLVAVDKYKDTYLRLKNTYGRDLVKNWTESTDPKKFVYEDVAIAAYLLLIWEEDRKEKNLSRKQSFVDLGCGNGLLVYILTKEGHKGLGIDMKKEKSGVEAITPSADHLYPEFDWIIGNHSDELTPWIPVMAARSSYKTSFFLLPCCPHDFDSKFSRHEKGKSKYETYMNYVKKITVECGFKPESDTLRIPSTKRICVIGRRRSYEKVDELMVEERRQAFIDKGTVYRQSISNKDISKPCVQTLKQTTDVDSHPPLSTDNEVGLQTSTIASVVQNMMTPRHNKLAENSNDVCMHEEEDSLVRSSATSSLDSNYSLTCGEKRTIESLESTDSGFYEQETTHSVDNYGTKRRKNSTGTVSSGESQSSDPENTSPVDANPKFTFSHNLNGRNVGSSQVVKATQWATGFQLRAEQTVRNCQKVPEQIKFKIVETVFNHILAAPDSRTVLLSNGKTWTMGGSVALNKVAALFDKPTMQELKSECGGLQTLLRNHSHVFQVTGGFVQLRDFTVSDPWIGRKVKKVKNNRDLQDTRKTTLCWFDTHHPCGCPRTKENCQFAHGQDELRNKLSRVKLQ